MKLLFSILCPKPELRASIEEIQACQWVNQQIDINQYKWEDIVRSETFTGKKIFIDIIEEGKNGLVGILLE